jgi:hypothetical protein
MMLRPERPRLQTIRDDSHPDSTVKTPCADDFHRPPQLREQGAIAAAGMILAYGPAAQTSRQEGPSHASTNGSGAWAWAATSPCGRGCPVRYGERTSSPERSSMACAVRGSCRHRGGVPRSPFCSGDRRRQPAAMEGSLAAIDGGPLGQSGSNPGGTNPENAWLWAAYPYQDCESAGNPAPHHARDRSPLCAARIPSPPGTRHAASPVRPRGHVRLPHRMLAHGQRSCRIVRPATRAGDGEYSPRRTAAGGGE